MSRIEIRTGGIGGGTAAGVHSAIGKHISNIDKVIKSFKTIKTKTSNVRGGVGSLSGAMDAVSARIRREEQRRERAVTVQNKAQSFFDLVARVDRNVANMVKGNREEFYKKYPQFRPKKPANEKKSWWEKTKSWVKNAWNDTKDFVVTAYNKIKEFYLEHKKIIDTIIAVIGIISIVVAVVVTGGMALVPMLSAGLVALGVSAGTALTIATAVSITVAVVAALSTLAANTMEIIDIWNDIEDETFQKWKKGLKIVSTASTFVYNIGRMYNSVKKIKPKQYTKDMKANIDRYSDLGKQHPKIKISGDKSTFTSAQRNAIFEENMRRNGGVLRDDVTGEILERYTRAPGTHRPLNSATIQNIGKGNDFKNALVTKWSAPTFGQSILIPQYSLPTTFFPALKYSFGVVNSTRRTITSAISAGKSIWEAFE